jgi:hypothetical protein
MNGRFDVEGINDGAGIGAGPGQAGRSTVDFLVIKGGIITSKGTHAGIGVGSLNWSNTSRVNVLTIGGANISTQGLYGFRATQVFFAGHDLAFSCSASGDVCVSASNTVLTGLSVNATTNSPAFGHGNWKIARDVTFYGQYSVRSLMEGFQGIPFIHIVNVSAPRIGGLLFSIQNGAYQGTVPFSETGFILSLPSPGVYHIAVARRDTGRAIGELCVDGHDFAVEGKETFFTDAAMCRGVRSPDFTIPESTNPGNDHELSIALIVIVSLVVGLCVIALIAIGVCLMKKKSYTPEQLLLVTGSVPGSSSFYKQ